MEKYKRQGQVSESARGTRVMRWRLVFEYVSAVSYEIAERDGILSCIYQKLQEPAVSHCI